MWYNVVMTIMLTRCEECGIATAQGYTLCPDCADEQARGARRATEPGYKSPASLYGIDAPPPAPAPEVKAPGPKRERPSTPESRAKDCARHKVLREARIAKGMCPDCGLHPPDGGTTKCLICRTKNSRAAARAWERGKTTIQRRKEAGLCTGCGGPRDRETWLCARCREDRKAVNARRYKKEQAAGRGYQPKRKKI